MKEIPLKINIDKYSTVGASVGAGEEQVGAVGALERWSVGAQNIRWLGENFIFQIDPYDTELFSGI